ncbi:MAG: hypothetical protein ACLTZM_10530 [Ruminococcus sp.]
MGLYTFPSRLQERGCKNVQANVWPYHWDEEEASKIVDWFAMLRHSKGDLAGQPIEVDGLAKV